MTFFAVRIPGLPLADLAIHATERRAEQGAWRANDLLKEDVFVEAVDIHFHEINLAATAVADEGFIPIAVRTETGVEFVPFYRETATHLVDEVVALNAQAA